MLNLQLLNKGLYLKSVSYLMLNEESCDFLNDYNLFVNTTFGVRSLYLKFNKEFKFF